MKNPSLVSLWVWLGPVVAVVAILLIALIFAIWWIATHNRLKRYLVKIDEAASGIDVALTKRYDLLNKEVAAVKGYAAHETKTLKEVTMARLPLSSSMKEKGEYSGKLSEALGSVSLLAENYPVLKASENFLALQREISESEEELQSARRIYNSNVSSYNQDIVTFPTSIVAKASNLLAREFFEADEKKKEDVKIEF